MVNPQTRRMLSMAFLAPDFLVSRMYLAARIPIGIAKVGASMVGAGEASYADKMAAKMGLNLALTYYLAGNWANRMNTKRYEGKARNMYENPSPHEADVYRRPDAKTNKGLYIEPTYSVSKVVRMLTQPVKTLQESSSPVVRAVSELATGHRPGGSVVKNFHDFATDVAGFLFPIPAVQSATDFQGSWPPYVGLFQQRQAAGFEPAKDAYVQYLKSGKKSDGKKADLLIGESGANPRSIINKAKSEYRSELRKEPATLK